MATASEVWAGVQVHATVGDCLIVDTWASRCWMPLRACDWEAAEFRLESGTYTDVAYACNVEVTGRTIQRKWGDSCVRVKITFVGDGEPDTVCYGWMLVK